MLGRHWLVNYTAFKCTALHCVVCTLHGVLTAQTQFFRHLGFDPLAPYPLVTTKLQSVPGRFCVFVLLTIPTCAFKIATALILELYIFTIQSDNVFWAGRANPRLQEGGEACAPSRNPRGTWDVHPGNAADLSWEDLQCHCGSGLSGLQVALQSLHRRLRVDTVVAGRMVLIARAAAKTSSPASIGVHRGGGVPNGFQSGLFSSLGHLSVLSSWLFIPAHTLLLVQNPRSGLQTPGGFSSKQSWGRRFPFPSEKSPCFITPMSWVSIRGYLFAYLMHNLRRWGAVNNIASFLHWK